MRAHLVLPFVVAALVLGACSDGETAAPAPMPREQRIAEVETLRSVVVEPALSLNGNVGLVAGALTRLRLEPPPSPQERLRLVEQVRDDHLVALRDAVGVATDLDLRGQGPDAVAVRRSWQAAVDLARELADEAGTVLDRLGLLAETDLQLQELVGAWELPGSRSQQLERLASIADRADQLAARLVAIEPIPECSTAIDRRSLAATNVAANTRELRDLVARSSGTRFDERREVLSQDPYGLGERLVDGDAGDADCWESSSAVVALEADVRAALMDVQAALNPPDLSTPEAPEDR